MKFKELLEQELDINNIMAELSNLDKTDKAASNIANGLKNSPDLQKAFVPFQQLVKQQLIQKKQQVSQMQAAQQQSQLAAKQQAQAAAQQQKIMQNNQRTANQMSIQNGTAISPNVNGNSANMQPR